MTWLLQVSYLPSARQAQRTREEKLAHGQRINAVPGLISKIWVSDAETGRRGGVYLFRDRDSAVAYQQDVARTRPADGATGLRTELFAVDEELSLITHGLPRAAVAA